MNHLSGMDAMFLHIESPEMPMHIGSLNVLDLPPGYSGDFYEDAKKMMSRAAAPGGRVHAQAGADALRPGRPGLGGRRRHRHRLPRAPHHPAQARHQPPAAAVRGAAAFTRCWTAAARCGRSSSSTASRAARWRCTPRCTMRASTARPAWPWPRRSSTWRPPAGSSSRRARARAATATSWASPSWPAPPPATRCGSTPSWSAWRPRWRAPCATWWCPRRTNTASATGACPRRQGVRAAHAAQHRPSPTSAPLPGARFRWPRPSSSPRPLA
jgi:hypothetical protein